MKPSLIKDVEKLKNENLALNKKRDELQVQIETVEQKRKIQQIRIQNLKIRK